MHLSILRTTVSERVIRLRQNRNPEVPWSCKLDELWLVNSASDSYGELCRSRSGRVRTVVMATSPVAADGTERASQCDIRSRKMDPGCRQCECPECTRGRLGSSLRTRRLVSV